MDPRLTEYPVRWDLTILALAIAGGSVDAMLILAFNVLTGAQTGNTVLLGAAIAQGQLVAALGSTVSVVGYVVGAAAGEFILVRRDDPRPWPSAVDTALIAELILLACLLIFWRLSDPHPLPSTTYALIAFAAGAMGIQNAAVLRLHGGPTTTYITGTLTTFATKLIRWLHLVETAPSSSPGRQDLVLMNGLSAVGGPWIYGLTWFVYLTGAVGGGLFFLHSGEIALVMPIAAIVAVILAGPRSPG